MTRKRWSIAFEPEGEAGLYQVTVRRSGSVHRFKTRLPPDIADLWGDGAGAATTRSFRSAGTAELTPENRFFQAANLPTLKDIGERVFDAIFDVARPGEGPKIVGALEDRIADNEGVELEIDLSQTAELSGIPWESLYLRSRDRFLAIGTTSTIVRKLDTQSELPPPVERPIRILVAAANPWSDLQTGVELGNIQERIDRLVAEGQSGFEIEALPGVRREQFRRKVNDWQPHVIHYIGHSDFEDGEGYLAFETDEAGVGDKLKAETLRNMLLNHRPWLVVLNSCRSGQTSAEAPMAGVAQNLLQRINIPFVIGMQQPVSDEAAIAFSQEFYTALLGGEPIGDAVTMGRAAIASGSDERTQVELITPALYTSGETDRIAFVDSAPAAVVAPVAVEEAEEQLGWLDRIDRRTKVIASIVTSLGVIGAGAITAMSWINSPAGSADPPVDNTVAPGVGPEVPGEGPPADATGPELPGEDLPANDMVLDGTSTPVGPGDDAGPAAVSQPSVEREIPTRNPVQARRAFIRERSLPLQPDEPEFDDTGAAFPPAAPPPPRTVRARSLGSSGDPEAGQVGEYVARETTAAADGEETGYYIGYPPSAAPDPQRPVGGGGVYGYGAAAPGGPRFANPTAQPPLTELGPGFDMAAAKFEPDRSAYSYRAEILAPLVDAGDPASLQSYREPVFCDGLATTVNFALGSSTPSPADRAAVQDLARNFACPASGLVVAGLTDSSGPEELNADLSFARAQEIADTVLDTPGGNHLLTVDLQGYGERYPVIDAGDGVVEPANRRAEVYLAARCPYLSADATYLSLDPANGPAALRDYVFPQVTNWQGETAYLYYHERDAAAYDEGRPDAVLRGMSGWIASESGLPPGAVVPMKLGPQCLGDGETSRVDIVFRGGMFEPN